MIIKDDKQKIQQLLSFLKLSRNALGIAIGEQNGSKFNHIISGRNGISEKLAKKITDKFPEINYDWLLSKSPNMLIKEEILEKNISNYIGTANGKISIDIIIDAILLNQEKFEENPRFKKYLQTIINDGVIEYQEKLLKEYKQKKD